jgi:hypothetical protein
MGIHWPTAAPTSHAGDVVVDTADEPGDALEPPAADVAPALLEAGDDEEAVLPPEEDELELPADGEGHPASCRQAPARANTWVARTRIAPSVGKTHVL